MDHAVSVASYSSEFFSFFFIQDSFLHQNLGNFFILADSLAKCLGEDMASEIQECSIPLRRYDYAAATFRGWERKAS